MKTLILAAALLAAPVLAQAQPSSAQLHRVLDTLPKADANHDGFVTRAEWHDFRAAQFDKLDRNHDGFLTTADAPRLMGRDTLKEAMAVLDANHDGRVSHAEFVDGPAPMFDRIDADHNGVIDPQELKKARDSQ